MGPARLSHHRPPTEHSIQASTLLIRTRVRAGGLCLSRVCGSASYCRLLSLYIIQPAFHTKHARCWLAGWLWLLRNTLSLSERERTPFRNARGSVCFFCLNKLSSCATCNQLLLNLTSLCLRFVAETESVHRLSGKLRGI